MHIYSIASGICVEVTSEGSPHVFLLKKTLCFPAQAQAVNRG